MLRFVTAGESHGPTLVATLEGIPAGLPEGTRVAHKTGWITGVTHDAALVYPPGRKPYVLVVLTKGIPDRPVAQKLIADISRLVWDELNR